MRSYASVPLLLCGLSVLSACGRPEPVPPTAQAASEFIAGAETKLEAIEEEGARASWLAANFITFDTLYLQSRYDERSTLLRVRLAKESAKYRAAPVSASDRRKLEIVGSFVTVPSPDDPVKAKELAEIGSRLEATYGQGKYCPTGANGCLSLEDITRTMMTSRDPAELLDLWQGWHRVAPAMRADYRRQVVIANEGARELGFSDLGELWRSQYDMPPDEFAADMDRQWQRVKPLYDALHCYVRGRLNGYYGDDVVAKSGPIPAHLLGNMWAQDWANVYDLVAPAKSAAGLDLTAGIAKAGLTELDMVRHGERFFTSLGFDPLPATFWERSLFVKPRDRDVVCHASAWDLDGRDDLRIKMCIEKTGEDFETIHHELGHNFYQREYKGQSILFRGGANDGFHEAIGDTISLSVTPKYLVQVGLLNAEPDASQDISLLLHGAMARVAFLPFGLLVDKWRWGVFSGAIPPEEYNAAWWRLREQYQGVRPPLPRTEDQFDAGAKYHIASNTPYARYFLAQILQFQFHRALCEVSGNREPLHRCSIYNSQAAGARLKALMTMGRSQPWPDALAVMTGQRELDAGAIVDYYAPLKLWLDAQNQGQKCGW